MAEKGSNLGTNVQVAVRCRPPNAEEKKTNQPMVVTSDQEARTIKISYGAAGKKSTKNYQFDKVFNMYSTQEEVFKGMVKPIVDEALAGFNCTIFAYGQTGTGKTHTMEGDILSEDYAGIVPRSVKAILEDLESSGSEFTIRVSFLELYNEELQDLLNVNGDKKLKLCEDPKKGGVMCQNLEEITVLNVVDIFDILKRGIKQRQTAATLCNKNSSRSHSIFTLKIMIREYNADGEEVVRHGQLNLVDLAGSECVGRSGAKDARAKEAGSINQSLLTLGRVITALVDHHGHIPYRDSKLTRLLQESLGGKAKTCIIATLSPSQLAVEESMSTLDYASRAKNIKNLPQQNQKMTKKVVMKEYCAEIENLKAQLQLTREKNGIYMEPEAFYQMEARLATQESQLTECEAALKARNEEVKTLRVDIVDAGVTLGAVQSELQSTSEQLRSVKVEHTATKASLKTARVELKASEAVVGEQVQSEMQLSEEATHLQTEVTTHRQDISKLLNKVDLCQDKEIERLKYTNQFSRQLDEHHELLTNDVDAMLADCTAHSASLCAGVSGMVEKGKSTCVILTKAIEEALCTLVDDAEMAKGSMVGSCDELNTHLSSTNQHIAATLRTLQSQLSNWLGDADKCMKVTQSELSQQKNKMDELSSSVSHDSNCQKAKIATFLQENNVQISAVMAHNKALESDLEQHIRMYKEKAEMVAQQQLDTVTQNVASIEEKMTEMLQNLVQSAVVNHSAATGDLSSFSEGVSKLITTGSAASSGGLSGLESSSTAAMNGVAEHMETSVESFSTQMGSIKECQVKAFDQLDSVAATVGEKKTGLDSTVDALVGEVDKAIQNGCDVVDNTAAFASKTLENIRNATNTMNVRAGGSTEEFNSYLSTEGVTLVGTLQTHFNYVQEQCDVQQCHLSGLSKDTETFNYDINGTTVECTGNTPTKQPFAPLKSLVSTRSHEAIRSEIRLLGEDAAPLSAPSSTGKRKIESFEEANSPVELENEGVQAVLKRASLDSVSSTSTAASQEDGEDGKEKNLTDSPKMQMDEENANPQTVAMILPTATEKPAPLTKTRSSRLAKPSGSITASGRAMRSIR